MECEIMAEIKHRGFFWTNNRTFHAYHFVSYKIQGC